MQAALVAGSTRVGLNRSFDVDLPLDAATLNERLHDISIWLVERHIPDQARILWQPLHQRIRIRFLEADDAGAFRGRFGAPLH